MSRYPDRLAIALMVVAMQQAATADVWRRDEVVGRIGDLVERARRAGVPVVWIRRMTSDLPVGSAGWQLVDELVPAPGEPIIEAAYANCFDATDLDATLAALEVGRLVVCGVRSDRSIRASVAGALTHGYDVTLVEDAHTTAGFQASGLSFDAEYDVGYLNALLGDDRTPDAMVDLVLARDAVLTSPAAPSDNEILAMAEAEDEAEEARIDSDQ